MTVKGVSGFGIRDNHSHDKVADFIKDKIASGSDLSVVSAYFTICAYEVLFTELDEVEELRKFFSLTENLRAARNRLIENTPALLYTKMLKDTPKEHRALLLSSDGTDLDSNADLQPKDKGILESKRKGFRQVLVNDRWAKMEAVDPVDRVLEMTERVLNPASHGSTAPLYEEEVRRAKKLIERLEHLLGAKF